MVEVLAAITGQDPMHLSSPEEVLDPDALIQANEADRKGDLAVSFTYEGFEVTLKSHGSGLVRPPDGGTL